MSVLQAVLANCMSASTPSSALVSGAGRGVVNGLYLHFGVTNGRESYTPNGAGDPVNDAGIYWSGSDWRITWQSDIEYSSLDDVLRPWLAAWIVDEFGLPPAPVVTEG